MEQSVMTDLGWQCDHVHAAYELGQVTSCLCMHLVSSEGDMLGLKQPVLLSSFIISPAADTL